MPGPWLLLPLVASMAGVPVGGVLHVSGYVSDAVHRYDAPTGAVIDTLDVAGGTNGPLGVTRGPDGRLYVASEITDNVLRFEAGSGAFVDVFVAAGAGGLSEPAAVVFGPDRNGDGGADLYISSFNGDSILAYDGVTGAFIDVFVPSGLGGLNGPDAGMCFGPDGHLYVPSYWSNRVLRYDGTTGAFIDVFVPSGLGGMSRPRTIVFRPGDGAMLVTCEGTDRVSAYHGTTGALIGVLIEGIDEPTGMDFDSAGFLYVASLAGNAVHRYDLDTGDFLDTVVPSGSGGLNLPTFVLLLESCPADLDGSGAVDFGDLLLILSTWGTVGGAGDLDGSGDVGFGDLLFVLSTWGPCA